MEKLVKKTCQHRLKEKNWQLKNRNFKIENLSSSDKSKHHSDWPLGTIIKIRPSRDNILRMVKVKTANREYVWPRRNLEQLLFHNKSEYLTSRLGVLCWLCWISCIIKWHYCSDSYVVTGWRLFHQLLNSVQSNSFNKFSVSLVLSFLH